MRHFILTLLFLVSAVMPSLAATDDPVFEKDPCESKSEKEFIAGKYVIMGQRDSGTAAPTARDLYTATAILSLDGCKLTMVRCDGNQVRQGIVSKINYMEASGWGVFLSTGKGNKPQAFLEMDGTYQNYAVLYGSGEYWRADPNGNWTCK